MLQTGYYPSKKPHNPMLDKPLKFIAATNKETQERALILDHCYFPVLAINQHVDATIDAIRRLLSVLGVDAVWEINDDWQRGQYEYMD